LNLLDGVKGLVGEKMEESAPATGIVDEAERWEEGGK
jgi:hypothetical protein